MATVSLDATIRPHGGRLIDRVLRGDALGEARHRASSLKRIALNARTMSDLELIAVGELGDAEHFAYAQRFSVLRLRARGPCRAVKDAGQSNERVPARKRDDPNS